MISKQNRFAYISVSDLDPVRNARSSKRKKCVGISDLCFLKKKCLDIFDTPFHMPGHNTVNGLICFSFVFDCFRVALNITSIFMNISDLFL